MLPLILSEDKLCKTRLENWLLRKIDFELPVWEPGIITTISSSATSPATLKAFASILKVLEYCWRHFTYLKLYKCFQILHPSPRVTSTLNRTKINYHWLNHLQALLTPPGLRKVWWGAHKPLGQHKEVLDSPLLVIPLINTRKRKIIR